MDSDGGHGRAVNRECSEAFRWIRLLDVKAVLYLAARN
jgi:hypothetical protein